MSSKINDIHGDASMGSGTPDKKKQYWYRIEYSECVLCGRGSTTRTRVYGKKPKNYQPEFIQYACSNHF